MYPSLFFDCPVFGLSIKLSPQPGLGAQRLFPRTPYTFSKLGSPPDGSVPMKEALPLWPLFRPTKVTSSALLFPLTDTVPVSEFLPVCRLLLVRLHVRDSLVSSGPFDSQTYRVSVGCRPEHVCSFFPEWRQGLIRCCAHPIFTWICRDFEMNPPTV